MVPRSPNFKHPIPPPGKGTKGLSQYGAWDEINGWDAIGLTNPREKNLQGLTKVQFAALAVDVANFSIFLVQKRCDDDLKQPCDILLLLFWCLQTILASPDVSPIRVALIMSVAPLHYWSSDVLILTQILLPKPESTTIRGNCWCISGVSHFVGLLWNRD